MTALKRFFLCIAVLLVQKQIFASTPAVYVCVINDSACLVVNAQNPELSSIDLENDRPNPVLVRFRKKQIQNKKRVAAALAFPFPFGIVGLHRIYLGCAPYVPVAYIATLGGIFGILPFIDCCVLLLEKDLDPYINNKKVFMWVR